MTPHITFQEKSQRDRFRGDQDSGVGQAGFKGDGSAIAGLRTGRFPEEGTEETGVVGVGLARGGEGVFFTDEDLGVLRGWTGWFDGTEDEGDYGAEITRKKGRTVDCHFHKVSRHNRQLCEVRGGWGGGINLMYASSMPPRDGGRVCFTWPRGTETVVKELCAMW